MSHTPTPWVCLKGDTFNPNRPYGICKYLSREAHYEIDGDDMDYPSRTEVIAEIMEGLVAKEDAELIVKAVNSYQAMKEAIRDMKAIMLVHQVTHSEGCGKAFEEVIKRANKALTLANGEDKES